MKQYLDMGRHILINGNQRGDRTGTGTRSVFGYQTRYNLEAGFPLVTTKKLYLKAIIHELLWFIQGSTNIKYLQDNDVTIWDEWADIDGELGPVYGAQWRSWPGKVGLLRHDQYLEGMPIVGALYDEDNKGVVAVRETIDQLANVINQIKNNPEGRRHIVSAWNVAEVDKMKLPPCHCFFQFYTREMGLFERLDWFHKRNPEIAKIDDTRLHPSVSDHLDQLGVPRRWLDCQLYQRSADYFLGVPFNIASYALLTMMIAQVTGTAAGEFVHTFGDLHIYDNHRDQVNEQMSREPRALPTMTLNSAITNINDFRYGDFTLSGYTPHPAIKAPVAV